MTKLSIVIPVYNVESYLRKCIESVLCPGLGDYEIVLVNDGSTDSSPEICAEYAAQYPGLIQFVSTENGGLGCARNNGIAAAKGEYLVFLDSDDYISENGVAEMLQHLDRDFDVALFDFITVNEHGRQLLYTKGSDRSGEFKLEAYKEILHCPPNSCNKIWKKSLFTDNGISFPPRLWFEDLCTSPKLYLHAEKIIYIPKAWYFYLQRSGSITNSKNTQRNLEIISVLNSVYDYYRQKNAFSKYERQLEYMAFYHQVISSCYRVNLADRNSPAQDRLYEDFVKNFPDYRSNPYIKNMSPKLKLIRLLLEKRMYGAYNLLMRLNNRIKSK